VVGNNVYKQKGTYKDTLTTTTGCDSIVTTKLSVKKYVFKEQEFNLCFGDTVKVGNMKYVTSGKYIDTLSFQNGCDSIITTDIAPCQNDSMVDTYNTFTPDGDGKNDEWIIDDINEHVSNQVKIYNRWGDLVRTFENYNNSDKVWKGFDKDGNDLPGGTYFYIIKIVSDNKTSKKSGWVRLQK
ncbi:MAG: gliding motility-associated C-terminal domain-containing protein, partial [Flavobacteriales bacterium]